MGNYIQAENLKCRRTFAKALIVIAPLCGLAYAALTGVYFIMNGYNWWYTTLLPGFITLVPVLINRYEDKKMRYRAVFALPVSMKRTWTAKVLLTCGYLSAACMVHLAGMVLGKATIYSGAAASVSYGRLAAAELILIVTTAWQAPFCLFLAKRFGMAATILANTIGGIALEIAMSTHSLWWLCPYSWGTRLMVPVLHTLPNGLPAAPGDALLDPGVIPTGILLSIALFAVLLKLTADWFESRR